MVLLKSLKDGQWIEHNISVNKRLRRSLDQSNAALRADFDEVWLIDGHEGAGKSTLAITLAFYVSPPERRHTILDRVVTKIEKADDVILGAKQYDAIVIDEAYGGMAAVGFMSKLNKLLGRRFREIRQKNLFFFIVMPSFMDINQYFATWRSRILLHVYHKGLERGRCMFFNKGKKQILYDRGKKKRYNYDKPKAVFTFRFYPNIWKALDKKEYDNKKTLSNLQAETKKEKVLSEKEIRQQIIMELIQRNKFIERKAPQEQLAQLFGVSRRTIANYCEKNSKIMAKTLEKEGVNAL